MAQNKLKIILCHTVILFLVFHIISSTNVNNSTENVNKLENANKTVTVNTPTNTPTMLRTIGKNASAPTCTNCKAALKIVKLIYKYYYPIALVIVSLVFGILLQFEKILAVLKRPYAPVISMFCNYIFSPLLCLGFAEMFFPDDPIMKQMLFLSGFHLRSVVSLCWTTILGGNIECSVIMCIVNTCLYFLIKPVWVDTVDRWEPHIEENGVIIIINENHTIVNSSIRFAALAVGVLIQYIFPESKKYAAKCVLWLSLIFIFFYASFMGTFHVISWFPFSFTDILKMNVAGWILSIGGYLVGFYFAILFKQSDGDILAIAVESNIPNEALGSTVLPMTINYVINRLHKKKSDMMDDTDDVCKRSSIDSV